MKRVIIASISVDRAQFDTTTTHMSFYDNFLNPEDSEYMKKSRNLTGEIRYMSPREYFKECATIFNSTSEDLKIQRAYDKELISKYSDDMQRGDKFPLCFINYADKSQEGLHRMLAAGETFGWDIEYPVLVIDVYDQKRHEHEAKLREMHDYERYDLPKIIDKAVYEVADYGSPMPDDFTDFCKTIKQTIEGVSAADDGVDIEVEVEVEDTGEGHKLCVYLDKYNGIENEVWTNRSDHWIEDLFKTDEADDDFEISDDDLDVDLEDIEKLLFK